MKNKSVVKIIIIAVLAVCITCLLTFFIKDTDGADNAPSVNVIQADIDEAVKSGELDINKVRELYVNAVDVHAKWFSRPAVSEADTVTDTKGRVYRAVTEGFDSEAELRTELKKYFCDKSCDYILDNNYIESDGKLYFAVLGMGFPGRLEVTGDSVEKDETGWIYRIYYCTVNNGKKVDDLIYEKKIRLVDGNYIFEDFYPDAMRFKFKLLDLIEESKMETVELTTDLQHSLNVFLSYFSKPTIEPFSDKPAVQDAVDFALDLNFRNQEYKEAKFESLDGIKTVNSRPYNYRIKRTVANETIKKYFASADVGEDYGKNAANYLDGYYYFQFTGGMAAYMASFATSVKKSNEGEYKVEFNYYRVESQNEDFYSYTDEQIRNATDIPINTYYGKGTACIRSSDISNPDTYSMVSYSYYSDR